VRIAIIGSGIAGLASAWMLSGEHAVTLYEANTYFGGHTHTHRVEWAGKHFHIDTGFIVHNPVHYPLLHALFDALGVTSQPTTMSFSVKHEGTGLEYNATTLDSLFCQRRNVLSPRFLGMVRDLRRFYREAPQLLQLEGPGPTLGDYLAEHRYGDGFRDEHLVPMASALWSSPSAHILQFPARYLVQFMAHHQMLQVRGRPQWQVVKGGSSSYVQAMRNSWQVEERLASPVRAVRRLDEGVAVEAHGITEYFDQVVLACHSDQALALLADPTERERDILGAMRYAANSTVLHTDARVLPRHRKAWAAWNAVLPAEPGGPCTVSYWMNLLQGLDAPEPFIVSLNQDQAIDPENVLRRMTYTHPIYTTASVAAQARKAEIQGQHRTWYAGAYWGWGFHEDGMRSAVEVAQGLGARLLRKSTAAGGLYA
jgi:predicted NAD/FAD-binding protein